MKPTESDALRLVPVDLSSTEDRSAWAAFLNQHYQASFPVDEATPLAGHQRYFWVRSGGQTVGTTGYIARSPHLAETVKTVVAPECRGKGFGDGISRLIEAEVRAKGFGKVMTTIYVTNLTMIFIKLRQGYLFEGFHPNHEKPGWHEYSLGKFLS